MRALIFCIAFAVVGFSQERDTRPQFEVASLKPGSPGLPFRMTGGPATPDPGRWTCVNWSLDNYLLMAYNIRAYQLVAPPWVRNAAFTVSATIPPGATRADLRLMLQRLLEERFQIVVHREQKEMSIYELAVAPGGSKLVEYVEPPASAEPAKPASAPTASGLTVNNGHARIQFRQQTMDNLAYMLSGRVERPVIDATGLKGKYAVTLLWDEETPSNTDSGPTIFKAIQDQLGLKLVPKKGPIEMLVIDRIERTPIEN